MHLSPFPRKFHPFATDSTGFLKALVVGLSPTQPKFGLIICSLSRATPKAFGVALNQNACAAILVPREEHHESGSPSSG
jgi:hypothetical protein